MASTDSSNAPKIFRNLHVAHCPTEKYYVHQGQFFDPSEVSRVDNKIDAIVREYIFDEERDQFEDLYRVTAEEFEDVTFGHFKLESPLAQNMCQEYST